MDVRAECCDLGQCGGWQSPLKREGWSQAGANHQPATGDLPESGPVSWTALVKRWGICGGDTWHVIVLRIFVPVLSAVL